MHLVSCNRVLLRCAEENAYKTQLKKCIVCVLFLLIFIEVKYKCIVLLSKILKCLDGMLFHLTFQNSFAVDSRYLELAYLE